MSNTRIAAARRIKDDILTAMEGNDRITDRSKGIVRRVLSGETYKRVGADFGLSHEGVRLACFRTFRKLKFKL